MVLNNWIKDTVLKLKSFSNRNNIVDKSFEVSLLIKGMDGVLELIGGILLIFLNPLRLNRIIVLLTQHELSEDHKDVIAAALVSFGANFNISVQYFWIFYLLIHGAVKIITVTLLWKKKPWVYPIAIITFVLFIIYQLYRYTIHNSISLIILTVFDFIMIILTFMEYEKMKNSFTY